MKKLLAIYGGPRRNENTEYLLDKFLECVDTKSVSTQTVILKDFHICPCMSCYGCSNSGVCVLKDDMREIYQYIMDSDIIVVASPIYFGNVAAQTKSMIDRCQAFWSAKYLAKLRNNKEKKRGYFIATAGSIDKETFTGAQYTLKLFFAACDAVYAGDLLVGNTDSVPVKDNKEAMKQAQSLCGSISI